MYKRKKSNLVEARESEAWQHTLLSGLFSGMLLRSVSLLHVVHKAHSKFTTDFNACVSQSARTNRKIPFVVDIQLRPLPSQGFINNYFYSFYIRHTYEQN